MEKLKQFPAAQKRLVCILLALICMLGLLPSTAFAAGPNTIVMEDCTHNGVYYESAALSTCWLHQMKFDYNGDTVMGFCADHGGGMGWSLEGHEWNNPREITDPTVKTMMAYFYAHSRGIFTDQAKALGVDDVWSSDYTWTMNAWVQAVVWRYQENLFSDPVAACAEELLYVYNNLEHTNYTSIDDVVDGTTLRDRAQYILDLGAQGVWGDCKVYEYDYAGPGSAQHPAYDVQSIIIGDLTVTRERYQMTVKKVDATNPNLALPGARFLVQNANGTFSQEVVTGSDGTVTLTNLEASTYSVTELDPPDNYQIDNAGPQYVVLPSATGETTATVTFTDTPRCLHRLCGDHQGLPNHTGGASAPVVHGLLFQQGRWGSVYRPSAGLPDGRRLIPAVTATDGGHCDPLCTGGRMPLLVQRHDDFGTVCGDPPGTSLCVLEPAPDGDGQRRSPAGPA